MSVIPEAPPYLSIEGEGLFDRASLQASGRTGVGPATSPAAAQFPMALAVAVGTLLGLAYAGSPVTFWFVVVVAGMGVWAGRGLPDHERRWFFGLLFVAVLLRLVAIATLPIINNDSHTVGAFPWETDSPSFKLRSMWMSNIWQGVPIGAEDFSYAFDTSYGWTTFIYIFAWLHFVLGPAPYGVHLVNVALFIATAILLHRLTRASFGAPAALAGFAAVLFLPSLALWSVSALKEPPFLFLAAVALFAAVKVLRSRSMAVRVAAGATLTGSIALIEGVRSGARLLVVVGLASGLLAKVVARRVLLWAAVPVAAVVLLSMVSNLPDLRGRVMAQARRSAEMHLGHVRTAGNHYKLLDERLYSQFQTSEAISTMTEAEAARFVLRSLLSVMVYPLPWQVRSLSEFAFLSQQVAWWGFVLLAAVGVVVGARRDLLVTCLLAGFAVVGLVGVGVNSGNFGTMVRHRDMVVPFVLCLSAVGGVAVVSHLLARVARRTHVIH